MDNGLRLKCVYVPRLLQVFDLALHRVTAGTQRILFEVLIFVVVVVVATVAVVNTSNLILIF